MLKHRLKMNTSRFLSRAAALLLCAGCTHGCGPQGTKSTLQPPATPIPTAPGSTSVDVVAAILAEDVSPSTRKGRGWIQIDAGDTRVYPASTLLYLFSALKRYPKVNRFSVVWGFGIGSFNWSGAATYNRRAKILRHREMVMCVSPDENRIDEVVLGDVTSQMLYTSGRNSINGDGGALENLRVIGCKPLSTWTARP